MQVEVRVLVEAISPSPQAVASCAFSLARPPVADPEEGAQQLADARSSGISSGRHVMNEGSCGMTSGRSASSRCTPATKLTASPSSSPRVFRRALTVSELTQIRELLEPTAYEVLLKMATTEFEWALNTNGHVPGSLGRLDYTGAITAARQLAYLHGLPALEADAVRWCFDCHRDVSDPKAKDEPTLSLDTFQKGWFQLLRAAVAPLFSEPLNGKSAVSSDARLEPSLLAMYQKAGGS